MSITIDNILLVGSLLLLLSILAGKTSYRFGVPTLIFFLGVGMLAGSEGIGGIYFDNPEQAQFIGVVALNIILFSGGLDTRWKSVRPVLWKGAILSTIGVFITTAAIGFFVWWLTSFSLVEGLLLGAIVSSTDAAAVFSILRSKNISLAGKIRPILELESGTNDPVAFFLTITLTGFLTVQDFSIPYAIISFFLQLSLGLVMGILLGRLSIFIINKIRLDYEGLYPVLALTLCIINYSFTDYVGGNGFLATYICAVILGNAKLIHKRSIILFFDGFAWLMQIILFLTLGLLVYPSRILPVIEVGILISLFMILVARPAGVLLSLSFFKIDFRNKLFISWVGLRGAVPIVFATFPLVAGLEKADLIFNLVFFITLISVMIQGTSISKMASWLGVTKPEEIDGPQQTFEFADNMKEQTAEIRLSPQSAIIGRQIYQLDLPASTLIVMIQRDGNYFVPSGSTVLEENDTLLVLTDDLDSIDEVRKRLS